VFLALLALFVVLFVALPLAGLAVWALVSTAIVGLVIGGLARLVVPGQQRIGLLATMLIGLVGSIVGGFIGHLAGFGHLVTVLLEVGVSAVGVAVVASADNHRGVGSGRRGIGRG
jgi:uncharacterized membrane protein YeaQ/YmgE (transglycosylase-associated protein family)